LHVLFAYGADIHNCKETLIEKFPDKESSLYKNAMIYLHRMQLVSLIQQKTQLNWQPGMFSSQPIKLPDALLSPLIALLQNRDNIYKLTSPTETNIKEFISQNKDTLIILIETANKNTVAKDILKLMTELTTEKLLYSTLDMRKPSIFSFLNK